MLVWFQNVPDMVAIQWLVPGYAEGGYDRHTGADAIFYLLLFRSAVHEHRQEDELFTNMLLSLIDQIRPPMTQRFLFVLNVKFPPIIFHRGEWISPETRTSAMIMLGNILFQLGGIRP